VHRKQLFFLRLPCRCLSVLLAVLAACAALRAQTAWQSFSEPSVAAEPLRIDRGSAGLWQTLLKLRTRASMLMIVAHPDDEDGALLSYESRGKGVRTILLTLNRGEGGQNVMSPDFWDALGILRTEELLGADGVYGVETYFSRVVDFGFSKTLSESMSKWGRRRLLYDAVRVVRITRPLVITSVWVGGHSDGHGQHEVSGEIAQEVLQAAADPRVFPDQIQAGLSPWQALKMYARVPSIAIANGKMYDYADRHWYPVGVYDYIHHRWMPGIPAANVTVSDGQYNPVLGSSYVQIGAEGLTLQKSQNGGVGVPPLGRHDSPYHRYVSVPAVPVRESSFFDGIDTSLMGIATLAKQGDAGFLQPELRRINDQVEKAIRGFSAQNPEAIAPALAVGMAETQALLRRVESSSLPDSEKYNVAFELGVKENQFNSAIAQSLGLAIRATVAPHASGAGNIGFRAVPTFQTAVPGQQFSVTVRVVNPSGVPVALTGIALQGPPGENWKIEPEDEPSGELADEHPAVAQFRVTVAENAAYTRPYFYRPNIEQPYYDISDFSDLNLPFAPYPLSAWADFMFDGAVIRLGQVVQTVERERGPGVTLQPLTVSPAISVWLPQRAGIIPLNSRTAPVKVALQSNLEGPAKGSLQLNLPAGWRSFPPVAQFAFSRNGDRQTFAFRVTAGQLQQKLYTIAAVAQYDGHQYKEGYESVGYPGIRPYNYYRPATVKLTGTDIQIPQGLDVGYVAGTGDRLSQSLESVGVRVRFLSSQDLAQGDLDSYDAIVLGVRAYAAREDIKTYNRRLLDYVKNGGVLIVQYNTPEYDHDYGPYPYTLSSNPEVVVDEESKVNILDPSSPLLNWPNKIGEGDFEGWEEERGHSFMKSWDPRYHALLETHDPGQAPQKGGLLCAQYGKGFYIYDAYALYRQLPEGVPGAYRLMVNLISLKRNEVTAPAPPGRARTLPSAP
jgi:LmbE family N-acetylglucosaminyl deacetylase